jgi:hypothetical protein
MKIPEKLYHYTSLHTLECILSSKSLMFNRADLVNDRKECLASDFGSFAPYIFLSCWTEREEEDIPLWSIYAKDMSGVRIEIPYPIFTIHKIDEIYESIITEDEIEDLEKNIFVLPSKDIVSKVVYTDEIEVLYPNIVKSIGQYDGFHIKELGTKKKRIWEFEKEWRFKLNIFPIDTALNSVFFPDKYNRLIEERVPPSVTKYFVLIDIGNFERMKIRMGPRSTTESFKTVQDLTNKYNPSALIEQSDLKDDIR